MERMKEGKKFHFLVDYLRRHLPEFRPMCGEVYLKFYIGLKEIIGIGISKKTPYPRILDFFFFSFLFLFFSLLVRQRSA